MMNATKKAESTIQMPQISGKVTSVSGVPLNGVKITCEGIETRTLADGYYTLDGLTTHVSQTHKVTASLQGYESTTKGVALQKGQEATLDFNMSKAAGTARIRGHVYDSKSKKKMDSGSVVLILPVSNMYRHTDRNGRYEFDLLPPGSYRVRASAQGYQDNFAEFTLTDGEEKAHDFFLQAKKSLEPPWG